MAAPSYIKSIKQTQSVRNAPAPRVRTASCGGIPMTEMSDQVLEARARRAARRIGLRAVKTRRSYSIDNLGGFQLVDVRQNAVVDGANFDMSAQEVIDFCKTA